MLFGDVVQFQLLFREFIGWHQVSLYERKPSCWKA